MFLADKYSSLLPSFHQHQSKPSRRRSQQQQQKGEADRFGAALAARLRGLLPLPASPLAALARVADLLALTLADAGPALDGAGEGDAAVVAAHLDAGVALLDACNAIAARLDRLRRRRLLARLALHLLSSTSSSSSPSSGRARARAALTDGGDHQAAASSPSPLAPLPSLPFEQPRGRLSAAARVLAAVDAVSSLAAAAAAAILVGGPTTFPRVSGGDGGDLPWAEPFNAVSRELAALDAGEVGAVDEAVRRLASALDAAGTDDDEAATVRAVAQEVEKTTEELAPRLDRLSDAVGGVFRAALGLRNAELGRFMVGPAGKPV